LGRIGKPVWMWLVDSQMAQEAVNPQKPEI